MRKTLLTALATSLLSLPSLAQTCDVNQDSTVNAIDVQLAVNMFLGSSSCTANVVGSQVCNQDVVRRVADAAIGKPCFTKTVKLTWTASNPSTGIVGYNIYRATTSGGPYTKVNATPVAATTYVDTGILPNANYYYVARAVNSSNLESGNSNETVVGVPPTS